MPAYMLLSVDETSEGEVEVEAGDEVINCAAKILQVRATNVETLKNEDVTLVIPVPAGPALLAALLTEDQFDALVNA
jgi:hypothetical protein